MPVEKRIVNNRVFLLGLDGLYRDAIKPDERGELLQCALRVAETLGIEPADVPIEGYYAEDDQLTEYFRLVRALQAVDEKSKPMVDSLPEFQRLCEVMSAPLYGRPKYARTLLPVGSDALSQALLDTFPNWTIANLTEVAHKRSLEGEEFSLVGLAARARDTVVLAALRESVVLYAAAVAGCAKPPAQPEYVWTVDQELERQATRFVDAFNRLFSAQLPTPGPEQAKCFWDACADNEIVGRCVRLGYNPESSPIRHYHWAISHTADGVLKIQEFWHPEVWTTERYRSVLYETGRSPDL